ncbi:hypothetical protein LJC59_08690, partial [Desulfovibrio sp. OttesenSCG-928-A18]|nr:hypothetical protein [Desulfovibrio sp. OttesenSCG-928-A18]
GCQRGLSPFAAGAYHRRETIQEQSAKTMMQHHTQKTAALLREHAALLARQERFADAFLIQALALKLAGSSDKDCRRAMDYAYSADMLEECLEFFTEYLDGHPGDHTVLNMLAGLSGAMHLEERNRACTLQLVEQRPFLPSRKHGGKISVLVLQSIASTPYFYSFKTKNFHMGEGHNNLQDLLDREDIACHYLRVDSYEAANAALAGLPRMDIIYNNIADADRCEHGLLNAARLCDQLRLPIINHPRHVLKSKRRASVKLFASCPGILAPESVLIPPGQDLDEVCARLADNPAIQGPVILRVPGYQGGQCMVLSDMAEWGVRKLPAEQIREKGLYIVKYLDVSFTDKRCPGKRFFPKYRAFFAAGKVYPIHVFVADSYNVHRRNSDELKSRFPWLSGMERDFLQDPAACFKKGRWEQLQNALAETGLDYVGVDFAPMSARTGQDELVIFECNPCMRNSMLDRGTEAESRARWRQVTRDMLQLICRKTGKESWNFRLDAEAGGK